MPVCNPVFVISPYNYLYMQNFYKMKNLALTLMMALLCTTAAWSQNVNVTATGGTLMATYPTLKGAFDAVNAGTHTGVITIDIAASTTETAPGVLNSSGAGSASYTSILIRPIVDGVAVSGPTTTGRGLIEFNGADNVTLDGDNPNSAGTNRNLTITNTAANTVTYTMAVRIAVATSVVTSANNVVVRNCIINGSGTGRNIPSANASTGTENTTYGIYAGGGASNISQTTAPSAISSFSTTVGAGATMNGLTISNNAVNACARGIAVQGSATSVINTLTVSNNVVGPATSGGTTSVYSVGITLQGFAAAQVSENTIQNMESYLAQTIWALDFGSVSSSGINAIVEKNIIKKVNLQNTGTYGVYGINLNAGNGFSVRNNMISDLQSNMQGGLAFSVGFGIFGIRINSGNSHAVYHNSVHLFGLRAGTANSSLLTAALGLINTAQTGCDIRNNILSNTISGGTTSVANVSIYLPSGASSSLNLTLNNNAHYSGTDAARQGVAQVGTTAGTGFYLASNFNAAATSPASNLRAYTSTLRTGGTNDNASFATTAAVPYTSATDLHIPAATVTLLESGGATVGVATDIDGDSRPNGFAPDMGADEFVGVNPNACTGTPTAGTISSVPVAICGSGSAVLTLTGATFGPGIIYQWKEATAPGGPYTNVGTSQTTYTTGTITSNRYYIVEATCSSGPSTATTSEFTLVVNPIPTASASNNGPACAGSTINLMGMTDIGTSFTWSGPGGYAVTDQNPVLSNVTAANAGVYTFTATANGCASAPATTTVVVNPVFYASVSADPAVVCNNGSSQLNAFAGTTAAYSVSSTTYSLLPTTGFTNGPVGDDIISAAITLPFPFEYFGSVKSQIFINTNGQVGFNYAGSTALQQRTAQTIPSATLPNDNISLCWADLNATTAGMIKYGTINSAPNRIFVIDFNAVPFFNGGGSVTGQIQLFEATQEIQMHISSVLNASLKTLGIENSNGTLGYSPAGRNNVNWVLSPPTSEAWVFRPSGGTLTYTWAPATFLDDATIANPMASNVTATTDYTVTISDGVCPRDFSVTVTVLASPTATVSGGGTVCSTDPLPNVNFALTGTAPWALTYNDGTNDVPITGINTSPYVITNAPAGTYTVVSISDANCTGTGSGSATVAVIICATCPDLTAAAPVAQVTNSTCSTFGGTPSGGSISAPAGICPIGSTLQYSTDGGDSWSTTVPAYNQSGPAQTIQTRCNCDEDDTMSSPVSSVTTVPGACPGCPDLTAAAPVAQVTNSTCSTFGGAPSGGSISAPAGICPVGSTLQYSTDGGDSWSTTVPAYNQSGPAQTIQTRCNCDEDDTMSSPVSSVTTVPGACPLCPDLTAAAPVAQVTNSTCSTFGGTPSGGFIGAPAGSCPIGSTLQYSTDGGANWGTIVPAYNQSGPAQTIQTRCNCDEDDTMSSPVSSVTTVPGVCPGCPDLTAAAPVAQVTNSTCSTFGGTPSGGFIGAPAGSCPIGSTLQYSTDGGDSWSTTVPTYNQSGPAQTIQTRCNCDEDDTMSSPVSSVTTVPGACPGCPDLTAAAPVAQVTNSTCSTFGGTPSGGSISAPAGSCPIGSTLQYSTDGGDSWSTTVPAYNQSGPAQTIQTRCNCDEDDTMSSPVSSVTTVPGACPGCPDLTAAAPVAQVTNSTCSTFGGTPSGGSISAPAGSCPIGSTLQYSTDGGDSWSTTVPAYNQSGPAQTIQTRCNCDAKMILCPAPLVQ
jgi:hypothetical protein